MELVNVVEDIIQVVLVVPVTMLCHKNRPFFNCLSVERLRNSFDSFAIFSSCDDIMPCRMDGLLALLCEIGMQYSMNKKYILRKSVKCGQKGELTA